MMAFFAQTPELQADTLVHEMLHGSLADNDTQLATDLGVTVADPKNPAASIDGWLQNGCKNPGEK
jgi:hypothetical protein